VQPLDLELTKISFFNEKCIYPFSLFKGIQVIKTKRARLHGVFLGFNPTMNTHQTNVIWIYKVGFVETLLQDPTKWLWERVDMHTAATIFSTFANQSEATTLHCRTSSRLLILLTAFDRKATCRQFICNSVSADGTTKNRKDFFF
jgi:hypothetical protein